MSLIGRWIGGFARAAFVLIDVRCIGRSRRREPLPRDSADTSDGRA